ncbi:NUDIX hydrolase [Kitasatospora sp. NPDC058060]|uniref:NUDIX hydrolase n=1 Tax=Kitasatospora sp. NPDC058060 TaxID=3346318 RepID=UPI0036E27D5D
MCLIRRQRPARAQLSFPSGVVEDGEDPVDALCAGSCSRSSASTWRCCPRRRCCVSSRTRRPSAQAR